MHCFVNLGKIWHLETTVSKFTSINCHGLRKSTAARHLSHFLKIEFHHLSQNIFHIWANLPERRILIMNNIYITIMFNCYINYEKANDTDAKGWHSLILIQITFVSAYQTISNLLLCKIVTCIFTPSNILFRIFICW